MISFEFSLSTGQIFNVNGNQNDIFQKVLIEFISNECPKNTIIKNILFSGNKINIDKTLYENKITQGSNILIHIISIQDIDLFKNFIPSVNNIIFQMCIYFLVNECKIPLEMLDYRANCLNYSWRLNNKKSGPFGYLKDYFPPIGWFGIGLKVLDLYDNGNNAWLGSSNQKGEWYTAYHPIKNINSIISILINGFRRGPFQGNKFLDNKNPLTNLLCPKCGEGVYFIPDINEAIKFTYKYKYLENEIRIVLMCRINPYSVRFAQIEKNNERWIVNGDKLNDPNGKKRIDEVRPYRILFFIEQ